MKRMNLDRFLRDGKGFVLAFSCLLMFLFIGVQDASAQNFNGAPTIPNNFVTEAMATNALHIAINDLKDQLAVAPKYQIETIETQINAYVLTWEDVTLGRSVRDAFVRITSEEYQMHTPDVVNGNNVDYAKIYNDLKNLLTN